MTWKLSPVPPQMAKTALALTEATETWIEKQKKAGSIIEICQYTEGTGGVAIVEEKSNDALYQKIWECPYSLFMQYCVTPLTDMKIALETNKTILKRLAG